MEHPKKIVRTNFFDRNSEVLRKSQNLSENPSFQPKFFDMHRSRVHTYRNAPCERVPVESTDIEKNSNEIILQSVSHCKSFPDTKAKQEILEDPESYIEMLKNRQREREIEEKTLRSKSPIFSELTYAAEADLIAYIKQIAKNNMLIKSEINKKTLNPNK